MRVFVFGVISSLSLATVAYAAGGLTPVECRRIRL
jgi:hypothetical protein